MKRSTAILVVLAVFAGLFVAAGCQLAAVPPAAIAEEKPEPPEAEPAKAGPRITFEKTVHDFGKINPRSTHHCVFKFKNTGSGTFPASSTIFSAGAGSNRPFFITRTL